MNFPIDTISDTIAFAVRGAYLQRAYPTNIGRGGGHYPATTVCAVYQAAEAKRGGIRRDVERKLSK